VVFLLVTFFREDLARLLRVEELAPWLWFLPALVLLTGVLQVLSMAAARRKEFRALGMVRVNQPAATVGGQIGFGWLTGVGAPGLVYGGLLGQALAVGVLAAQMLRRYGQLFLSSVSWTAMRQSAVRYRNFPLYIAPYSLVGVLRERLIFILLGMLTGTTIVGLYAVALKFTMLPVTLISGSLNTVFFQRVAAAEHPRALGGFVIRILTLMVLFAVPPLVLFVFHAEWIFGQWFGVAWRSAGLYASLLAIPAFTLLLTAWLDRVFDVLGRQRLSFWLELSFTATALTVFGAGLWAFDSVVSAVALFAGTTALYNVLWLGIVFRVAEFPLRGFGRVGLVLAAVVGVAVSALSLGTRLLGPGLAAGFYGALALAFYGICWARARRNGTRDEQR
jgi:O-antigen/teichoic acid export membrane protein